PAAFYPREDVLVGAAEETDQDEANDGICEKAREHIAQRQDCREEQRGEEERSEPLGVEHRDRQAARQCDFFFARPIAPRGWGRWRHVFLARHVARLSLSHFFVERLLGRAYGCKKGAQLA